MIHNTKKILAILQQGLNREKDLMKIPFYMESDRHHQKGVITGIEIAMSWIQNNTKL